LLPVQPHIVALDQIGIEVFIARILR
jgi:hypothetical protein